MFRVIDSIVSDIIRSRDVSGNHIEDSSLTEPVVETPTEPVAETPTEPVAETRECVVCYKKALIDDVVSTPCNHYYCKGCFFKWLKESNTCAYCRNPFTEYTNWEYSYEEENEELEEAKEAHDKLEPYYPEMEDYDSTKSLVKIWYVDTDEIYSECLFILWSGYYKKFNL